MRSTGTKTDTAKRSSSEEWQMEYIAKRIGVSFQAVSDAKRAIGTNDGKEIEEYLRNNS
jgi:hypothetical protein